MLSSFQHHPPKQSVIQHHAQQFSAFTSKTVHHPASQSAASSIILQNSLASCSPASSSIIASSIQNSLSSSKMLSSFYRVINSNCHFSNFISQVQNVVEGTKMWQNNDNIPFGILKFWGSLPQLKCQGSHPWQTNIIGQWVEILLRNH